MPKINFSKRQLFTVAGAIAFLVLLHYIGLLKPVESLIARTAKPAGSLFYNAGYSLGLYDSESNDLNALKKEVEVLRQEKAALLGENAELLFFRQENKKLREFVGLYKQAKHNYILANVVARDIARESSMEHNRLIINKGANHQLEEGLLVIDAEGLVIGKLKQVRNNLSEVALLSSSDCRLAVTIQNQDRTMGVTQGQSGLTISLDFVPQTELLSVGDTVVTSGLEDKIPPSFVLGKLNKVNKESNEIWQNAVIEPLADLANTRIVAIVLANEFSSFE